MTIVAFSRPVPFLSAGGIHRCRRGPEPRGRGALPSRRHVADLKPGRLLDRVGKLVPAFLAVDPFARKPHQDQTGQADKEEREVPESKQSRFAMRECEEVALASRAPKTTVAPTMCSRRAKS